MSYLPDNYDLFVTHDAEQQRKLDRLPKCDICQEPIQDDYCYVIDDEIFCEHCLNECFKTSIEDVVV